MKIVAFVMCFALGCSGSSNDAPDTTDGGTPDTSNASTDSSTNVETDSAVTPETAVDSAVGPETAADTAVDTPPLPGAERTFTFINQCSHPVWVGVLNNPTFPLPEKGGFALEPKASHAIALPNHWGGRFWGRTGCAFDATGKGTCATGDCGAKLECNGAGGNPPASLAEFLLSGSGGKDFYDVSLVDGYNLPIGITPVAGTFTKDSGDMYDCGSPACVSDLNTTCPAELQVKDATGVIACMSACEKFHTDEYCCAGAHNTPATCPPSDYSKTFKAACPTAYSYAYDDKTSTFTCKGKDYVIKFCP